MASRSMMPKSCKIWKMGVPLRLLSPSTSSYCKSSISPCSFTSANNGLITSAMHNSSSIRRRHFLADRLRELKFLQLGLDRNRVLRLGDDFLARNHALQIFINQKTVQRHHAVLRAGLDVRLDAECFVVANERGDGRCVDHDFKHRHAARLVNARNQQL